MSELRVILDARQFAETVEAEGLKWVKAAPWDKWEHPAFGTIYFPRERGEKMAQNFKNNVRGHEISTDYEHGLDASKGTKASGWIKDVEARDDGLYLGIDFTETAKQEIRNGEWKYFSYEFMDEWEHPHTQTKFQDVLIGGGLTNRPWIKGLPPLNFSELYEEKAMDDPKSEVADKEHGEPGTGQPREDEKPGKDHEPGTREDSPPVEPEAEVSDLDKKLRDELGLDSDADIIKYVKDMKDEVEPLREAAKAMSEKKAFAEMYPEQANELERLRKRDQEREAKSFSERYEKFVVKDDEDDEPKPNGYGFSALVLQKLEETHKKFSEGTATVADYRETIDLITSGKGILQYSELGTSIVDSANMETEEVTPETAGRAFSEKVNELMESDNLDRSAATKLAAEKHPEIFKAYRESVGR